MADDTRAGRIARRLFEDHAARRRFENLSGDLAPDSVAEAYEAQRELVRLWTADGRDSVAGYKIALTSQAIRDLVGVDEPCGAAILASTVRRAPEGGPAEVGRAEFVRLGLEFELAFRMGSDTEAGARYDAASIRAHVDAAAPAFELIEDRDADYSALDAASLVADNAWCGGIVLGRFSTAWAGMDLSAVPVALTCNGETETATTGAAMGNPLNSLAWLATLLAGQGRPLAAGDIVMSGSTLATRFAAPGDRARYEVEGLGAVELRVA